MKTNNLTIYFFLILFFALSCNNDDREETIEEPQLYSYHYRNMDFPLNTFPSSDNGIIEIQYDNTGRPTKRNGGFARLPISSGFEYIYSKDIYDDITYGNNDVTIQQKSVSQPELINSLVKYFSLLNGKIVQKVNRYTNYPTSNDTIQYYYSGNKLIRSLRKQLKPSSETKYYYNLKGNLDSTVTRKLIYNPATQNYEPPTEYPKWRTVEIFKNYDNSENPTKKLMLLDDIFNRSLSENNYAYYEKVDYNDLGEISQYLKRNWTFSYTNGKIDFSK